MTIGIEKKRPCNICGRPETGDRQLCGKHWRAYQERDKAMYATKAKFVAHQRMQLEVEIDDDAKKFAEIEITASNAEEMKLIAQAYKEREMYLKHLRQNRLESGELVLKTEANKGAIEVMRGILEILERKTDIWPEVFAQQSAGDVKEHIIEMVEDFRSSVEDYLSGL